MNANLVALLYLVSGVLFILALRGLSNPETARRGNQYGMIGMAIAIGVTLTLLSFNPMIIGLIAGGALIGGGAGVVIARRIPMTAMPQLVAAFHSLVGLAAVLVAAAAFLSPEAFGIADAAGQIKAISRVEMALGAAIGAAVAAGLHPDLESAVAAMTRTKSRLAPDPDMQAHYDARYHRFTAIRDAMRPLWAEDARKAQA